MFIKDSPTNEDKLLRAVENADLELAKQYIAQGTDPNMGEGILIDVCIDTCQRSFTGYLVEMGADPNLAFNRCLNRCMTENDIFPLQWLIRALPENAFETGTYNLALSVFALNGYEEGIKNILKYSQPEIVKTWLIDGEEHITTNQAIELIDFYQFLDSVKQGNKADVVYHLEHGVDPNEKDYSTQTALLWACYNNQNAIVETLLDNGAFINQADDLGTTALHIACSKGNRELLDILLARGADYLIEDKSGNQPIDIAEEQGHTDTVGDLQGFIDAMDCLVEE